MLWSTDGHSRPESYLLAVLQMKEGLEKVLTEYVDRGALALDQAVNLVQDLLFNTANDIYSLSLKRHRLYSPAHRFSSESVVAEQAPTMQDVSHLKRFLEHNPSVKFLRLQWLDYTATARVRLLPIKQALNMFRDGKHLSITKAALGLLQTDVVCEGFSATGQHDLVPIFSSIRISNRSKHATLQCEFRESDGTEVDICPRTALRRQVERGSAMGLEFLVGFEIEVIFMTRKFSGDHLVFGESPITSEGGHAWSAVSALHDGKIMSLVETIVEDLERAGIELLQFHPETAPGQVRLCNATLTPFPFASFITPNANSKHQYIFFHLRHIIEISRTLKTFIV